ncbi:MAG: hypothetical protein A2161_07215, partial [Candidatus Schekmanbacteria bacterium RBG_13_48_7]
AAHHSDVDLGIIDVGDNVTASLGPMMDSSAQPTLTIYANSPGDWANFQYIDGQQYGVQVKVGHYGPYDGTTHFSIFVTWNGNLVEQWLYMTMDDTDPQYCESVINGHSNYIVVEDLGSPTAAPANQPHLNPIYFPLVSVLGVYDTTTIIDTDYIGTQTGSCGMYSFDSIDEINLLSVPGVIGTAVAVQKALLGYCQTRTAAADGVFAICDPPQNYGTQAIRDWRMNNLTSMYGALYWPWLKMQHPTTGQIIYVPPSGHVQGIHSAVAQDPGVYQAPAGTKYAVLRGVLGLQFDVGSITDNIKSPGTQDSAILDPVGVNIIRFFEGYGFVIWGASTMSPDTDFKYVNIARYFNFLEESIKEGLFDYIWLPNDPKVRRLVTQAVDSFLYNEWQTSQAIVGTKKAEAYFVVCDESNNSPVSIKLGQLYVDVGVNVSRPIKFLIVRIGVSDGSSSVEILKQDQVKSYL